MEFGKTFLDFCRQKNIGKWNFDFKNFENSFELTFDEFHEIGDLKIVFNGENGGLVLGNSHSQGGIHLLQQDFEKNILKYAGEMEGFEYLSTPLKSEEHSLELYNINELKPEIDLNSEYKIKIPEKCKIINTTDIPVPIILLSGYKQFIINKKSSLKYIKEIIEIELKY